MGYNPHEHIKSSLGKNLSWYSSVGVWLTITLVALMYNELEWLKCWSHRLLFLADGLRGLRGFSLLSSSSRNCLFLKSKAWKNVFQRLRIDSLLCFLQKFQDNLYGKVGKVGNLLVLLSTDKYKDHLTLLEQSQNSI